MCCITYEYICFVFIDSVIFGYSFKQERRTINHLTIIIMRTFNVETLENGQNIVRELNANVAIETFFSPKKYEFADLYTSPNECDILIGHNTCQPVNTTFVETVVLIFQ